MMGSDLWTINRKVYPNTDPLVLRRGDRARVRFMNMSPEAHPMHLYGQSFAVVALGSTRYREPIVKDVVDAGAHMGSAVAVTIAHPFGWRVQSEVLALERRQLDLEAGTLRLEPGTTKNDEARTVYLTPELKTMLAAQLERVDRLSGHKTRSVFDRYHIVSPTDLQDVARRLAATGTFSGTAAPEKLASRPLTPQNTSTRL